jgi:hypothetical protein
MPAATTVEKPLAAPPTVAAKAGSEQKGQMSQQQQQQQQKDATTAQGVTATASQEPDRIQALSTASSVDEPDKKAP